MALDVAITTGAVGLFFWRFLLAPPLTWEMGGWMTLVTLAYPLLDLLLLCLLLALALHERRGEAPRPELLLIGLGTTLQIIADLLYNAAVLAGTYYTGHPMDTLWTASSVFFVLAARAALAPPAEVRQTEAAAPRNGLLAVAAPYLALAAGMGLLVATERDPFAHDTLGGEGVFYGTLLVTALVVARQLVAFGENGRLTRDLARHGATLDLRVRERTAELEALSRRYRHDALHDALTGLPNRAHFRARIHSVAAGGGRVRRALPRLRPL